LNLKNKPFGREKVEGERGPCENPAGLLGDRTKRTLPLSEGISIEGEEINGTFYLVR